KRPVESAPVEEAFESVGPVFESVGPVVEQGMAAAPTAIESEWAAAPAVEIPTFEMPPPIVAEPEPLTTEPEPVAMPEAEAFFAQMASMPEPQFEAPVSSQMEASVEPELEPIGQGQPIPQLTPIEEPSIIEVTEPEPAGFEALRQTSEPF